MTDSRSTATRDALIDAVAKALAKRAYMGRDIEEYLAPKCQLWHRMKPEAEVAVDALLPLVQSAVAESSVPMPASDFRLMSESEKYGTYASAYRRAVTMSELYAKEAHAKMVLMESTPSSSIERVPEGEPFAYYDVNNMTFYHSGDLTAEQKTRFMPLFDRDAFVVSAITRGESMYPKIIVNNDVVWLQLSEHDLVNLEALADYNVSDKGRIAVRKACEEARAKAASDSRGADK